MSIPSPDFPSPTASRPGVLVIGEALIDIVQRPGRAPVEHVGGSPANVALGLGRLGSAVRLHSALGKDPRGERIATHLSESGVVVDPASWSLPRTSTALARVSADGAATYEFDLDWTLSTAPALAGDRMVHVGSVGAFLDPGAAVVESFLSGLGDSATVSFDPNIRPALVGDHAAAVARVERLAALSDVVKLSDEDAAWIYPGASEDEVLDRFLALGVRLVSITLGGRGAVLASHVARVAVAAPKVTVIDTVGAGDTFMSAMINQLSAERNTTHLDAATLKEIGTRAAVAAAITVQRPGADLPTRQDLDTARAV